MFSKRTVVNSDIVMFFIGSDNSKVLDGPLSRIVSARPAKRAAEVAMSASASSLFLYRW